MKKNDLSGQKFHKLLVLKQDITLNKQIQWMCQCDCGKILRVRAGSLRNGNTKSCGCIRALETGQAAFNAILKTYTANAKNNNREFSLTRDDFKKLIDSNCYYCGEIPKTVRSRKYGNYVYNGIDRMRNGEGYRIDNCVTCCWDCNKTKHSHDCSEFLSKIEKIYKNRFNT